MVGRRRSRWQIGVLAVLAFALTACTGISIPGRAQRATDTGTSSSSAPATSAQLAAAEDPLPELTPWELPDDSPTTRLQELAGVVNGVAAVTVQQAVDLFNLFIPMPGATESSLPAGQDGLEFSMALQVALHHREGMTAAQQKVLDGVISGAGVQVSVSADGVVSAPTPHHFGRAADGPTLTSEQTEYVFQAVKSMEGWQAHRPDLPRLALSIIFRDRCTDNAAYPIYSTLSDDGMTVEIGVCPQAMDGENALEYARYAFDYNYFLGIERFWAHGQDPTPMWLGAGAIEWAFRDLYRGQEPIGGNLHNEWFTASWLRLESRGRDAWPLFETLRQYGIDPYPTMKAMLEPGGGTVEDLLAIGGIDSMPLAMWRSTQTVRRLDAPIDFNMAWPTVEPPANPVNTAEPVGPYGRGVMNLTAQGGYSQLSHEVAVADEVEVVMLVAVDGPVATLANNVPVTLTAGQTGVFCVKSGKCACPEGTSPKSEIRDLTPPMIISSPQLRHGPHFTMVFDKFNPDRLCTKPAKKPDNGGKKANNAGNKKPVRKGTNNGDPHLTMFDGYKYDLTEYGEFVTARVPATGFEVQTRVQDVQQFPVGVTAVAIKGPDGTRLTFTADPAAPFESPKIVIRNDGTVMTGDGQVGTGTLTALDDGDAPTWLYQAADGSTVQLRWVAGFFVQVSVPEEAYGKTIGMLGNANGSFLDDLRLPDGSAAATADAAFAKAWYVTDQNSLFDYDPGKSTTSYRLPSPTKLRKTTTKQRTACREALGPQATLDEVEHCAFDMAASGDSDALLATYQQLVQDRIDSQPQIPDTTTITPYDPNSTTSNPTNNGSAPAVAVQGKPMLELAGTITGDKDLIGSVHLEAGALLLARASACPADRGIQFKLTSRSDSDNFAIASLCGTGNALSSPREGDTLQLAEAYLLVLVAGDYDISLTAADGTDLSVQFFADPHPTVLEGDTFDTQGYDGTLTGIGDVVLAWSSPDTKMLRMPVGGQVQTLCVGAVNGPLHGQKKPWTMESICKHPTELISGPYPGEQLPFLIFSRTDGPQHISIAAGR